MKNTERDLKIETLQKKILILLNDEIVDIVFHALTNTIANTILAIKNEYPNKTQHDLKNEFISILEDKVQQTVNHTYKKIVPFP